MNEDDNKFYCKALKDAINKPIHKRTHEEMKKHSIRYFVIKF